jgi:hypothetical protein
MWPMIWPTPYAMTTSLGLGGTSGSRIELPVVPAQSPLPVPAFAPPAIDGGAAGNDATTEMNVSSNVPALGWTVSRDPVAQQATVDWRGGSSYDFPWGREAVSEHMVYRADDLHPEKSSVHGETAMNVSLKDRLLDWRTLLDVRSDLQNFYVDFSRELRENGKLIRRKEWHESIPRDGQ